MAEGSAGFDPTQAWLGDELERLFALIEAENLRLGVRERTSAYLLASQALELRADTFADRNAKTCISLLKPALMPILAKTLAERDLVNEIFAEHYPDSLVVPLDTDDQEYSDQEVKPVQAPKQTRRILATLLSLFAVLLIALLFWADPFNWFEPEEAPTPLPPTLQDVQLDATTDLIEATTPQTHEEPVIQTQDEFLERVIRAAEAHDYAPTMREMSIVLAADDMSLANSTQVSGWTSDSYLHRMVDITGLPPDRPLQILAFDDDEGVWAQLAFALARIEQPGQEPDFRTLRESALTSQTDDIPDTYIAAARFSENRDALINGEVDLITWLSGVDDSPASRMFENSIARAAALAYLPLEQFAPLPWANDATIPASKPSPVWLKPLSVAIPLIIALSLATSLALKRAYLRRRRPDVSPLHRKIVSDASRKTPFSRSLFSDAARRLLTRSSQASAKIDVVGTINTALENGGETITPIFECTHTSPEYLVLIERNGIGDQNAARMEQMARHLEGVLHLDIYYFQSDPGELHNTNGSDIISIRQAQTQFPEHRLILLGSGRSFLDPLSDEARQPVLELEFWSKRAMLTPIPISEWGAEEYTLARTLDMPIGRATPEGFQSLAILLGLEGAEKTERIHRDGDGMARPLPSLLRNRSHRYLFNAPPDDATIKDLVREIRNYLDPAAFDWFAALAVYPSVQWDLTVYLGVHLARRPGDDARTDPLYDEDRLAAITQLPWLRAGQMPNWLRRVLIARMSPERHEEVRQVVEDLIDQGRLEGRERIDDIKFRIGRENRKDTKDPDLLMEDEVLLDFLASGKTEDFFLSRLSRLAELFDRKFFERIGGPEGLAAFLALGYALAVFFIAPITPVGQTLVTGGYAPLLTLGLGGLIAIGFWNAPFLLRAGRKIVIAAATPSVALILAFILSFLLVGIAGRAAVTPWTAFIFFTISLFMARLLSEYLEIPKRILASWFGLAFQTVSTIIVLSFIFREIPEFALEVILEFEDFWVLLLPAIGLPALVVLLGRWFADQEDKEQIIADVQTSSPQGGLIWRGAKLVVATIPLLCAGWLALHMARTHDVLASSPQAPAHILKSAMASTGDHLVQFDNLQSFSAPTSTDNTWLSSLPIEGAVTRLAVHSNTGGLTIAYADQSGAAYLADRGEARPVPLDEEAWFARVAFSEDGRLWIASETSEGAQISIGDQEFLIDSEFGGVEAMAAISNTSLIIATTSGELLKLDTREDTPQRIQTSQFSDSPVRTISSSHDPDQLSFTRVDGSLWRMDLTQDPAPTAVQFGENETISLGTAVEYVSPVEPTILEASEPEPFPPFEVPPGEELCAPPEQNFVVYFEYDSTNLTTSARTLIDQAVSDAHVSDCQIARAMIRGHQDATSTREYARSVSRRRADVVRLALVSRGVSPDAISTEALGYERPAVAMQQGAREPLNRRAEIQLISTRTIAEFPQQNEEPAPRLYVYYARSDQEELVNTYADLIENTFGYYTSVTQATNEEIGVPPDNTELRYFDIAERPIAIEIGNALREDGISQLTLKNLSELRTSSTAIRDNHFELWFGVFAQPVDCEILAAELELEITTGAVSGSVGRGPISDGLKSRYAQLCETGPSQGELPPGASFRDGLSGGGEGPEMVVLPSGSFLMGSPEDEEGRFDSEGPQRVVEIGYRFAVSKYEVTWDEWEACVADGGCDGAGPNAEGGDEGWGKGSRPVINVDWNDAQAYARWLSGKTGLSYRLLSEAEWEYAARAGTTTRYSWGDQDPTCSRGARNGANFSSCSSDRTEPVGYSAVNAFGLHDMHGNVWEWTQDCWNDSYTNAPLTGAAWEAGECSRRVLRGGSWFNYPRSLRSANRYWNSADYRFINIGFRLARTL